MPAFAGALSPLPARCCLFLFVPPFRECRHCVVVWTQKTALANKIIHNSTAGWKEPRSAAKRSICRPAARPTQKSIGTRKKHKHAAAKKQSRLAAPVPAVRRRSHVRCASATRRQNSSMKISRMGSPTKNSNRSLRRSKIGQKNSHAGRPFPLICSRIIRKITNKHENNSRLVVENALKTNKISCYLTKSSEADIGATLFEYH